MSLDAAAAPHDLDDEARFGALFGDRALLARPSHYHLMLLGEESGLDLHLPWPAMARAASRLARHEEAFSWLALSRGAASDVHATLMECVLRDCSAAHGGSYPALVLSPTPLSAKAAARTSTFLAYALAAPGPRGEATVRAARERAPELFPGCSASAIPARLSFSLRGALEGAERPQREEAIEAALEALEISSQSQRGNDASPKAPRL